MLLLALELRQKNMLLLALELSRISSLKIVSGGRAPGKSSSLAPPQLSTSVTFHCFRAVRLEKVEVLYGADF